MKKIFLTLLLCSNISAVCVHEYQIKGHNLLSSIHTLNQSTTYFQKIDGSYEQLGKLQEINPSQNYLLQENQREIKKDYDDRYIKYYKYQRLTEFLSTVSNKLETENYKTEVIGKSIEGRDLFSIYPKRLDPNKKVILMFARHHGDEGSANWIVEGFLKKALGDSEFNKKFQLVLYPMINPDGAEAKRRYNKKGRDLNRSWGKNPSRSKDEIVIIQRHLNKLLLSKRIPVIALDMHGSFTEDFIYRVSKSHSGQEFFNLQQEFITSLGKRDPWQQGNFQVSNGSSKMSRIHLIRDYKVNALTHESIRDIPLSSSRTLEDLILQGEAIVDTLMELY